MSQTTNAGIVTAYGAAVRGGYQGSYNDFCTDLANLTQVVNELANLSATAETLVAGSAATATYSNGVFSFGIPRGDKGEAGDTGNGIESVSLLSTSGLNKTYRITFTDGTHFDYVVADGKSIVSTVLNVDYTLTITYNDGTTWTSESIRGATGATPNLTIGTVTTGAAGTPASAEITGPAEDPVLNLTIPKGADGDVSPASLASTYSASQTYAVGDYVWYSGQLYCCTTAITTAEAWTSAHWTAAKLADDVKDLKSSIADVNDYALNAYATDTASGAIATFSDGAEDIPIKSLSVAIEPVQDLHGQENPYPAGGGRNKLNPTGTTQTINGVTFTMNADGTVVANGTATAEARFTVGTYTLKSGTAIKYNGSVGGSASTYCVAYSGYQNCYDGDITADRTSESSDWENAPFYVIVFAGATVSNKVFYPMIRLATETDDTFAPYSNICPISGHTSANVTRTGKNLFDPSLLVTQTGWCTIPVANAIDGKSYTLSVDFNDSSGLLCYFMEQGGKQGEAEHCYSGHPITKTKTANNNLIIVIRRASGSDDFSNYHFQLEFGSATAYEPYRGTTYPITFPSGTGTVYGGNITVNQDGSGALNVDMAIIDMGSLSWTKDGNVFYSIIPLRRGGNVAPSLCDSYAFAGYNTYTFLKSNLVSGQYGFTKTSASNYVLIRNDEYSTAQDIKNALTGVQMVYTISIPNLPAPIPLTASQITTLLGQNNLWADCNRDVSVTYRADTALYVQKKIAEALNA